MDRYDERKPVHREDEPVEMPPADEPREGDVLGLGGGPVPKAPDDPTPDNDPESVARRRERASGLDEPAPGERDNNLPRGKGATGIDMGAGGTGTGIKTR